MAYYECHITLSGIPSGGRTRVGFLSGEMNTVAFALEYKFGLNVLRQKIELVVYDTRQK